VTSVSKSSPIQLETETKDEENHADVRQRAELHLQRGWKEVGYQRGGDGPKERRAQQDPGDDFTDDAGLANLPSEPPTGSTEKHDPTDGGQQMPGGDSSARAGRVGCPDGRSPSPCGCAHANRQIAQEHDAGKYCCVEQTTSQAALPEATSRGR